MSDFHIAIEDTMLGLRAIYGSEPFRVRATGAREYKITSARHEDIDVRRISLNAIEQDGVEFSDTEEYIGGCWSLMKELGMQYEVHLTLREGNLCLRKVSASPFSTIMSFFIAHEHGESLRFASTKYTD